MPILITLRYFRYPSPRFLLIATTGLTRLTVSPFLHVSTPAEHPTPCAYRVHDNPTYTRGQNLDNIRQSVDLDIQLHNYPTDLPHLKAIDLGFRSVLRFLGSGVCPWSNGLSKPSSRVEWPRATLVSLTIRGRPLATQQAKLTKPTLPRLSRWLHTFSSFVVVMRRIAKDTRNSILSLSDTSLSSHKVGGAAGREPYGGEQSACRGHRPGRGRQKSRGGRPAKLTATDKRWLIRMVTQGEVDNAVGDARAD